MIGETTTLTPIDEVLKKLDEIIDECIHKKSRLGYFASLYRRVTARIKQGVLNGEFQDGPRMERLDHIFAFRYFTALKQYQSGDPSISRPWKIAFDATVSRKPLIVQHLLLGINAHINIDLAVAAAETSPGDEFNGLKDDFMTVNAILASLVPQVMQELTQVSRFVRLVDQFSGDFDDRIINFSIQVAREEAWAFGQELALMSPTQQMAAIKQREVPIADLARGTLDPGWPFSWGLVWVRMWESSDVVKVIRTLNAP